MAIMAPESGVHARPGVADGSMSSRPPQGEVEVVEGLMLSRYWTQVTSVSGVSRIGLPATMFRTTYFAYPEDEFDLPEVELEPVTEYDEW